MKCHKEKGKICTMEQLLEVKLNKFCTLIYPSMEKWTAMHEEEQNAPSLQLQEYGRAQPNASNLQYLPCLKDSPKFIIIA